jgi:hypothetical protein
MLETTEQRTIEGTEIGSRPTQNGNAKRRGIARAALLAVGLAVIAAGALAVVSRPAAESGPEHDLTSGFEYGADAAAGRVVTDRITTPYFGNIGELNAERDITSGFEYETDATSGKASGDGVTSLYFGNSPELNPDH